MSELFSLPTGYELREATPEQAGSSVLFARELESGDAVVIKTLGSRRTSTTALAAFRREYEILQTLDIPAAVKPRALLFAEGRPYLVMDDVGGVPLSRGRPLTRTEFFVVAKSMAVALGGLHRNRIVHKNVNPDHIIVHPETCATYLVDFSIASVLPRETLQLGGVDALEGDLPYISPEQTGRMNRSIDKRTDFYSLGVTLYELLAGRRPFSASTPLEWVHCHIAKTPRPLCDASSDVPRALGAVVMKLFEKAAEDRYQSSHGLLRDLQACEEIGDNEAMNREFEPGAHDHSDQFQVSQRLYGRQEQMGALLAAFDAVSQGPTALMLVSGYSGIGKTSLIAEIHKPIVAHSGYFTSGKFDQFKRDIPYASLIQAFTKLVRQLLTESARSLATWRRRLLASLGTNGQVIVEVIPEVATIVGPQPPVPKLGSAEAQNRFNSVFRGFVRAFAGPEHPLAIFLDDLQWADPASLELLQSLCTDPSSSHVFLIGAYRDNEVDAAHPLTQMLRALEQGGVRVDGIHLDALGRADVERLVADSLNVAPGTVAALARLVHDKTLGNPFFVTQFLRELYESEALTYSGAENRWVWDLELIDALDITGNVIELMAGKIVRLAVPTQNALTLAACIGNEFDLGTLAVVSEIEIAELIHRLMPALHQGLVVPTNDVRRVLQRTDGDERDLHGASKIECRFLHDRVQQAAYSLISDADKRVVHLEVGRGLLARLDESKGERLFDVVNHMNLGSTLIDDPTEQLELAKLNLQAGNKAKDSAAYMSAAAYLRAGLRLLPGSGWDAHFSLAFELNELLSECAYLSGDFDEAEALFDLLLSHARNRHESSVVCNIRMELYSSVGRFTDSIEAGFEGLELFGIDLRAASDDLPRAVESALSEIQRQLAGRELMDLANLPPMSNADVEDSMRLLMNLTTQTYIVDQDWFPLIAMKMVSLSLEHGNCGASSFGYGYLGVIFGTLRGEYEVGRRLAELSLELNGVLNQPALYCKLYWIHGGLNNHWTRHIRSNIPLLRESIRHGHSSGDYVFGSWAYYYLAVSSLLSGKPLGRTLEEADAALAFFTRIKNETYAELVQIVRNVVRNLQGSIEERPSLSDDAFDEVACLTDLQRRSHGAGIGRYNVMKMMVLCIHERYEEACRFGAESEQTVRHLTAQPLLAEHYFYHSVSLAGHYPQVDPDRREEYRATIKSNLDRLAIWAESCPENYLHKKMLVEAELARLDGDVAGATASYAQSINSADEHGFVHNEAIANVRAGKYCVELSLPARATAHFAGARNLHAKWGAQSRVADLEASHPGIVRPPEAVTLAPSPPLRADTTSVGLDAMTLVKATRAISSELRIGSLFEKMMEIMVESAGAHSGYLFQGGPGELVLRTSAHADSTVEESEPAYAGRVVNYVRRTNEVVVLGTAMTHETFGSDPHLQAGQIGSVVCMPMRRKEAVVGTLYFENRLEHAFTPARVELLEVLAAQAAVSLENATLYNELNQANRALEARAAELARSNEDLEQFAYVASHDLQEPLRMITQFMQRFKRRYQGALDEEADKYIFYATDGAERMKGMIDGLLAYSRVGQKDLTLGSVDTGQMLTTICRDLASLIHETSAVVELGELPVIQVDATLLTHVFQNLVQNALKYRGEDPPEIRVSAERAEGEWVFTVKDNGIGFDARHAERIFQPFHRLHEVGKYPGSGIGLAIVRRIVGRHGGRVWAESEGAGTGAAFRFSVSAPEKLA